MTFNADLTKKNCVKHALNEAKPFAENIDERNDVTSNRWHIFATTVKTNLSFNASSFAFFKKTIYGNTKLLSVSILTQQSFYTFRKKNLDFFLFRNKWY